MPLLNRLLKATLIPVLILMFFSCFDPDKETSFGLNDEGYDVAVPLVNTKVTIATLAGVSKGNTGIRIAPDGKATILYNGEVIRRTAAAIFPPFPGVFPYEIPDTFSNIALQFNNTYYIKKAIFRDTKINFYFENNIPADVKIRMKILELTKNGVTFEREFTLKYQNTLPVKMLTDQISIDGWTLQSETNSLTFQYDAVLPDGRKVVLDKAQMNFDIIKFSYIDGYLGYHVFAVDGSVIDVGLFDKWVSGSFDFQDPKITISVDNAFGLPVRSRVNRMDLTSITGKTVSLESPFINTGIDFAYPSFSELGKIKTTDFDFNKNNSNIREIFNEKTKSIAYDISALVNPDRDTTIKGFITDDSYFVVNVAVEVPMNGSVNKLLVADTMYIDLSDFQEARSIEFKAITTNDFPADIKVQAYFLDENKMVMDQLFENDGFSLSAARVLSGGKTLPGSPRIDYINFSEEKLNRILKAKKLAVVGNLNTTGSNQKNALWIYDDYGIGLKLGAKVKYRKK